MAVLRMVGKSFITLLRRISKIFLFILRVYGIFFCTLSLGYFFNNKVFNERLPIAFTFSYFSHIFIEGALIVSILTVAYLLIKERDEAAGKDGNSPRDTKK